MDDGLLLLLTPLLALPLVLLLRFVGCGESLPVTSESPPRYRDFIMGEDNNPGVVKQAAAVPKGSGDVIGYWRLLDPEGATEAANEKDAAHKGKYMTGTSLPAVPPNGPVAGSESAPGTFIPEPGLIVSDKPANTCRSFVGAFVQVPHKQGLYTDDFTLEAWVDPEWGPNIVDHEHVLFFAGGHYVRPFESADLFHGFSVFADGTNRWQVRFTGSVENVFSQGPLVSRGRTHVAVSVRSFPNSAEKLVRLLLDGRVMASALALSYSPPHGAPLLIGVSSQDSNPNNPVVPRHPFLGLIQDVVLHKRALSDEELENHFFINR